MDNVLQNLFRGFLSPTDGGIPDSNEYRVCVKEFEVVRNTFYKQLQEVSPHLAENYDLMTEDYNFIQALEQEQAFIDGFSLGMKIFAEAIFS